MNRKRLGLTLIGGVFAACAAVIAALAELVTAESKKSKADAVPKEEPRDRETAEEQKHGV